MCQPSNKPFFVHNSSEVLSPQTFWFVAIFFVFEVCTKTDPSFQILNTSSMLTKHNGAMGFTALEPLGY